MTFTIVISVPTWTLQGEMPTFHSLNLPDNITSVVIEATSKDGDVLQVFSAFSNNIEITCPNYRFLDEEKGNVTTVYSADASGEMTQNHNLLILSNISKTNPNYWKVEKFGSQKEIPFLKATNFRIGDAGSEITSISNDATMGSNSATALATQQSIKTYVDGGALGNVVLAPNPTTDNSLVRFNGTAGQIQGYTSGGPTVSDTGVVTINSTIQGPDDLSLLPGGSVTPKIDASILITANRTNKSANTNYFEGLRILDDAQPNFGTDQILRGWATSPTLFENHMRMYSYNPGRNVIQATCSLDDATVTACLGFIAGVAGSGRATGTAGLPSAAFVTRPVVFAFTHYTTNTLTMGPTNVWSFPLAAGVTFQTSGGTAAALNYYETSTHTTNWAGTAIAGPIAGNLSVSRIGGKVHLAFPQIQNDGGTLASTITMVTVLPARFRPATSSYFVLSGVNDEVNTTVLLFVTTAGDITIYGSVALGNFTVGTGLTNGIYATTLSYLV